MSSGVRWIRTGTRSRRPPAAWPSPRTGRCSTATPRRASAASAPGSSNRALTLPTNVAGYSGAVAQAVSQLRLAGVEGPYALVLGTEAYTAATGGSDEGYPEIHHLERIVDGGIIWAPAIAGGVVLTTRGGDFELALGQDISIGYLSHTATTVALYFQETFTFRLLTAEASVALAAPAK